MDYKSPTSIEIKTATETNSFLIKLRESLNSNDAITEVSPRLGQVGLPAAEQRNAACFMHHRTNTAPLIRKVSPGKHFIR